MEPVTKVSLRAMILRYIDSRPDVEDVSRAVATDTILPLQDVMDQLNNNPDSLGALRRLLTGVFRAGMESGAAVMARTLAAQMGMGATPAGMPAVFNPGPEEDEPAILPADGSLPWRCWQALTDAEQRHVWDSRGFGRGEEPDRLLYRLVNGVWETRPDRQSSPSA